MCIRDRSTICSLYYDYDSRRGPTNTIIDSMNSNTIPSSTTAHNTIPSITTAHNNNNNTTTTRRLNGSWNDSTTLFEERSFSSTIDTLNNDGGQKCLQLTPNMSLVYLAGYVGNSVFVTPSQLHYYRRPLFQTLISEQLRLFTTSAFSSNSLTTISTTPHTTPHLGEGGDMMSPQLKYWVQELVTRRPVMDALPEGEHHTTSPAVSHTSNNNTSTTHHQQQHQYSPHGRIVSGSQQNARLAVNGEINGAQQSLQQRRGVDLDVRPGQRVFSASGGTISEAMLAWVAQRAADMEANTNTTTQPQQDGIATDIPENRHDGIAHIVPLPEVADVVRSLPNIPLPDDQPESTAAATSPRPRLPAPEPQQHPTATPSSSSWARNNLSSIVTAVSSEARNTFIPQLITPINGGTRGGAHNRRFGRILDDNDESGSLSSNDSFGGWSESHAGGLFPSPPPPRRSTSNTAAAAPTRQHQLHQRTVGTTTSATGSVVGSHHTQSSIRRYDGGGGGPTVVSSVVRLLLSTTTTTTTATVVSKRPVDCLYGFITSEMLHLHTLATSLVPADEDGSVGSGVTSRNTGVYNICCLALERLVEAFFVHGALIQFPTPPSVATSFTHQHPPAPPPSTAHGLAVGTSPPPFTFIRFGAGIATQPHSSPHTLTPLEQRIHTQLHATTTSTSQGNEDGRRDNSIPQSPRGTSVYVKAARSHVNDDDRQMPQEPQPTPPTVSKNPTPTGHRGSATTLPKFLAHPIATPRSLSKPRRLDPQLSTIEKVLGYFDLLVYEMSKSSYSPLPVMTSVKGSSNSGSSSTHHNHQVATMMMRTESSRRGDSVVAGVRRDHHSRKHNSNSSISLHTMLQSSIVATLRMEAGNALSIAVSQGRASVALVMLRVDTTPTTSTSTASRTKLSHQEDHNTSYPRSFYPRVHASDVLIANGVFGKPDSHPPPAATSTANAASAVKSTIVGLNTMINNSDDHHQQLRSSNDATTQATMMSTSNHNNTTTTPTVVDNDHMVLSSSVRTAILLTRLSEYSKRSEFHSPTTHALDVPTYSKGILVMAATVGIIFHIAASLFSFFTMF
eukprot:TRINITY_DN6091_c0_g1_i4.p1 TRINITY_DN6091_c0_g1~~TRINITY_DN6091_c0_g1_i4.p1  ORF type:complete len:1071 (+),score=88.00 TRINITY_DN6091_c0_g1_i4:165-3377(+)